MKYKFLPDELHSTADKVESYLICDMGLKKVGVEKASIKDFEFCPTLSGISSRGDIIWVEISNSTYPQHLDKLILDCRNNNLPVKLYVANPKSRSGKINQAEVARLSKNGVGYLIVEKNKVDKVLDALELSLCLPEPLLPSFPKNLRLPINQAYTTYRGGAPVKGVAALCDEIESLIRSVAKKARGKGKIPESYTLNLDICPLESVINTIGKYQLMTKSLIGRCYILTGKGGIRNNSSHPPKDLIARKKRHQELKLNFETCLSLLKDLSKIR